MHDAFMAEKSVLLDIASAASISTHWPVSCFLFHNSINLTQASLLTLMNETTIEIIL
jgi:hypothetical protein